MNLGMKDQTQKCVGSMNTMMTKMMNRMKKDLDSIMLDKMYSDMKGRMDKISKYSSMADDD